MKARHLTIAALCTAALVIPVGTAYATETTGPNTAACSEAGSRLTAASAASAQASDALARAKDALAKAESDLAARTTERDKARAALDAKPGDGALIAALAAAQAKVDTAVKAHDAAKAAITDALVKAATDTRAALDAAIKARDAACADPTTPTATPTPTPTLAPAPTPLPAFTQTTVVPVGSANTGAE